MNPRAVASFLAPVLVAACQDELPPAGQLRIHVVTDAPVSGAPDSPELFDRVEMTIVTRDGALACDDCARTLVMTHAQLVAGLSFGIVPRAGRDDLVLRARMFWSRHGLEGNDDALVESWTRVPTVGEEGIVDMTVSLPIAQVGAPIGSLTAPIEPTLGVADASIVGSFAGAKRRQCSGASPAGAVCVPGGASWMGDRVFRDVSRARQGGLRRIIVLRPFHLDATEVTVGAFRKGGNLSNGEPIARSPDTSSVLQFCTYADPPSPEVDALPVTCISRERANAYCTKRGGHLPTEAQYAYVQGGLKSAPYVWGEDLPSCMDATWGRIPTSFTGGYPDECVRYSARPGAQPAGKGLLDRLRLGDEEIVDLAGNAAEIALDDFEADGEACWPRGLLVDPLCVHEGGGPVGHGGSFFEDRIDMRAGQRSGQTDQLPGTLKILVAPFLGFRCAYDDL